MYQSQVTLILVQQIAESLRLYAFVPSIFIGFGMAARWLSVLIVRGKKRK